MTDRDDLDGCDIVGPESRDNPTEDRDVAWLVLVASRIDRDTLRRIREVRGFLGGP